MYLKIIINNTVSMNNICNYLDHKMQPKRLGENKHVEYDWSLQHNQLIPQFFFQLVRTKNTVDLEEKLSYMLGVMNWREHTKQLTMLYKLIGQTRDIINGKGEMDLTWFQLKIWFRFYPNLAKLAFFTIVDKTQHISGHQYGSWKDVKYFLHYLKTNTSYGENHPLIDVILTEMVIPKLREDAERIKYNEKVSLLGRWFPREKSSKKFNWIFSKTARLMYPEFIREDYTTLTMHQKIKAHTKQKIYLRKLLSKLSGNKGGSDTPQVKMCSNRWSELDFNKMTSITLRKQKIAISNLTKKGEQRSERIDRIECATKFKNHIEKVLNKEENTKVNGKRLNIGELAKDAYSYNKNNDPYNSIRQTINLQWENNKINNKGLEDKVIIAMSDTSSSMECDELLPLNNSIGLGIRISEITHPVFRDRLLTFDATPSWVRLDDCKDFVEKAQKVRNMAWGCNTDFHRAIDLIIEALVENNVHPNEVKKIILAVLSDMQFDSNCHNCEIFDSAYDIIKRKFERAGLRTTHKMPYSPPHILFWNLRKTNGFPATTFSENITFLSGYSSALLNIFVKEGLDTLRETTPSSLLEHILNEPRYDPMERNITHPYL